MQIHKIKTIENIGAKGTDNTNNQTYLWNYPMLWLR